MAAPVPELDPHGLRSSTYGFFTWPPRPLQPLVDFVERKLAHSLRLVLPRITAPAARSRSTTNASRAAIDPSQRQRSGGRHHPIAGVDVVLDEDRDAVQRPAHALAFALGVERVGNRQRVGIELDDRPQRRTAAIDRLDARGVQLDEPPRGVAAGRHRLLQLGDRRFVELECAGAACCASTRSACVRTGGQSGGARREWQRGRLGESLRDSTASVERSTSEVRRSASAVTATERERRRPLRRQAIDDGAPGAGRGRDVRRQRGAAA